MELGSGVKALQLSSNFWEYRYRYRVGRDWGLALLYTRTTASIRRYADQENKKRNPKPRRQTKLFDVGVLILLITLSECVSMFYMHICVVRACVRACMCMCRCMCVCVRINMCFSDLRA